MRRILALSLLVASACATAANQPMLEYREKTMEAAHNHLKAISEIVVHGVPMRQQLPAHARALADFSSMLADLFPPGSQGNEASPLIWKQWEEFVRDDVKMMRQASDDLLRAIDSGDLTKITDQYYQTLEACKHCHRNYRER